MNLLYLGVVDLYDLIYDQVPLLKFVPTEPEN